MAKGRLPLGERLIQAGKITREQLDIALKEQQRTGKLLGEILNRLGFVAQDDLTVLLAADAGIPHIELNGYPVQPEALKLIPEATVRRLRAFPLSTDGRAVKVALANVFDVRAIDELRRQTGRQVEVLSATEGEILRAIDHYYGQAAKGDAQMERSIREAERGVPSRAEGEAGEAGVIRLVDQLITEAVQEGATDIHVEPEETTVRVRYRVDGVLHNATTLPKAVQASVIARLKIMANINIAETRLPQDGRILFHLGPKRIDLRVSTFPTVYGENVVLRLLDRERLILGLEKLGFGADTLSVFKRCLERPYGIILVTGPTGSGKTTTLYSALAYLNSVERNIITLEDPVEYELPMIRQSQINVRAGLTFSVGLRSILRQDPDIIFVGEIRDAETMEMAVRSALTGHLVFSTLHTNDSAGAVPRMLDLGVEPFLLSSSLIAVLAQRLVRRICSGCKAVTQPDPELLKKTGLAERAGTFTFYEGKGCQACRNTGFRGRVGIFEAFVVSPGIARLIQERADSATLRRLAQREGMRTMFEDGLRKVLAGITTLEEVTREALSG